LAAEKPFKIMNLAENGAPSDLNTPKSKAENFLVEISWKVSLFSGPPEDQASPETVSEKIFLARTCLSVLICVQEVEMNIFEASLVLIRLLLRLIKNKAPGKERVILVLDPEDLDDEQLQYLDSLGRKAKVYVRLNRDDSATLLNRSGLPED
jgi:hypothetical protein